MIRPAIERVHCFSMKSTNFSIADGYEKIETFLSADVIKPEKLITDEVIEFKDFVRKT